MTPASTSPRLNATLRCLLVAGAFLAAPLLMAGHHPPPPEPTAQPPERHGQQRPLETIARLLQESSAARMVSASENVEALERRDEAWETLRRAEAAQAAGRLDEAQRLGNEAARIMFEAVHLAESPTAGDPKKSREYQRRLESVNALLEAHQRLIREESLGGEHEGRRQAVRRQVDAAEALYAQGRLDEARERLDGAYEMARMNIEEIRDGSTVVHRPSFANQEEEYRYELRRHETHQRLVQLSMQERGQEQGLARMVDGFVNRAEELRIQAQRQAARGDFGPAVETLDAATAQLVRALRSTGLFIPG